MGCKSPPQKRTGVSAKEDCPDYIQCRYINSGYRFDYGWRRTFRSIFELHNETLNIWTHMIGFVLMLVVSIFTLNELSPFGLDHLRNAWPSHFLPNLDTHANADSYVDVWFRHAEQQHVHGKVDFCPVERTYRLGGGTTDLEQAARYAGPDSPTYGFCARAPETRAKLILKYLSNHSEHLREIVTHLAHDLQDHIQHSLPDLPHFAPGHNLPGKLKVQARHYGHLIAEALTRWREAAVHAAELGKGHTQHTREQAQIKLAQVREELQSFVHGALEAANFSSLVDSLGVKKHDFLQTSQQLLHDFTEHLARQLESPQPLPPSRLAELFAPTVRTPVVGYLPRWPFAVFVGTALICFSLSTSFHLFSAVSKQAFALFQTLDYSGIVLLIGGSTFPVIYYGFFCHPLLKTIHLSIVSFLALFLFVVLLMPRFGSEEFRNIKVALFVFQSFMGTASLFHFMLLEGEVPAIFWYLLAMGILYLSGAAIYLLRCPESCVPGKFDIWGHSHQWWHILVVLACFVEFYGVHDMYLWRMEHTCPS